MTKCLCFALILTIITISNAGTIVDPNKEICTTKSCKEAANMILENIDTNADPCEDFNQFACGSFINNRVIADDKTQIDLFDILRSRLKNTIADLLSEPINEQDIDSTINAKKMFKSCVDEAWIEANAEAKLLDFIDKIFGGWPVLNESTWNESAYDPIETIIKTRLYGLTQIVGLIISSDPKQPRSYVLRVRQPAWFFTKEYYKNDGLMNAYKDYIFNFIRNLNPKKNDTELRNDVEKIYEIEKHFTELTIDGGLRRNAEYKNMTIKDLSQYMPAFDWKRYIMGVFANVENVTVTEDEPILVDDLSYLQAATELYLKYAATQEKDLKNLLVWLFAKDRTTILPRKFNEAKLEFDKVYRGTSKAESRSVICSNYVSTRMEYAVGRLYVSKYFDIQSKSAATEMIEYIRSEFKNIVRNSEWMDNDSKGKALEKADNMDVKIGYPDFLYDEEELNELYRDYQFSDNDIFTNTLIASLSSVRKNLNLLRKVQTRTDWIKSPIIVDAYYSQTNNQITFPAGILQAPFYDSQSPNYLNFGGIGSVIGHEITHGFDDRGRRFDKDGVFFADGTTSLWTNQTIENYKLKASCIIDQYSNFTADQVKMNLNGFQTQGENIADNGGIKQAFYAYQNWVQNNKPEPLLPGLNFSQNQLFFINYAQVWCGKSRDQELISEILRGVHSPGSFRILGPTSNFNEFAKAFNCKAGTKNNPDNKCAVW